MTTITHNSKNYNHVFNQLQDYMLTNEFIYKFSKKYQEYDDEINDSKQNKNKQIKKSEPSIKTNEFSPVEKDKLFWCFYILYSGMEMYELNKSASFKTEKEFKFKTAEKVKEFKDTFKPLKLRINELQDEFINQPSISIKGLVCLCYIYNINILYVKNKSFYEIFTSSEGKINIIVENKVNNINNIYIPLNLTDEMIKSYRNNYWKIDNLNSSIKAISAYTLSELQDICKRLSIQTENNKKKMTKKELYENILRVL